MADIARIKRNIDKMMSQGAPEADIDAYVASEGVSVEQLRGPAKAPDAAKADDPVRSQVRNEIDDLRAKGVPIKNGITRQMLQGATFNFADDILAGLATPLEMIQRGLIDPRDAFKYAKAREDLLLEEARKDNGVLGTAAEIAGGFLSGAGLARGGLSLGSRIAADAGLIRRGGAAVADGLATGAVAGAGEGNTLEERGENAAKGGLIGGAVSAVAAPAVEIARRAAAPVISNIRARANPQRFAEDQVARAVTESRMTPAQIADDVAIAAREGQPMFTVADAMGNPGQRMLSTTARAPGAGRTDVVEFLDARQADQGRRVSNALAEGFDSPETANRMRTRLTNERDTIANAEFNALRNDANPVDLTATIAEIDRTLAPGLTRIMNPGSNIADDSVESVLRNFRSRLTDDRNVLTDFTAIQRVRGDLADKIATATRAGEGNKVRLLSEVRRTLDEALENASQGFRRANADYRGRSQAIDAIDDGGQAARRGRVEDTIPDFQGRTPDQQAAFRAGYVDPLIESVQGAPYGSNKARSLTSDAFRGEAAAMAPGNDLMQRRIARENTMFQTRNAATGNSKTAENFADDGAMGIDPTIIGQVLSGNFGGAVRSALSAGANMMSGNTPEVREQVARILLQRGGNVPPRMLQQMLDAAIERIERVRQTALMFSRGGQGAVAVTPSATNQR